MSTLTLDEIGSCDESKKMILFDYLSQIHYTILDVTKEAQLIANQIVELRILTNKSLDDATHIGVALVEGCDYIISWNFKHMVNIKTVKGVRAITNLRGYSDIDLVAPNYFLEEG